MRSNWAGFARRRIGWKVDPNRRRLQPARLANRRASRKVARLPGRRAIYERYILYGVTDFSFPPNPRKPHCHTGRCPTLSIRNPARTCSWSRTRPPFTPGRSRVAASPSGSPGGARVFRVEMAELGEVGGFWALAVGRCRPRGGTRGDRCRWFHPGDRQEGPGIRHIRTRGVSSPSGGRRTVARCCETPFAKLATPPGPMRDFGSKNRPPWRRTMRSVT